MPFKPGETGNAGGRPKALKDIEAEARKLTPASLKALKRIIEDPEAHDIAVVKAVAIALDRGWGRARQVIDLNADVAIRVISETPLTEEEWQNLYGRKDAK